MKIFITGSAGFIGSSLLYYLKNKGHTVYGIDNYSNATRKNEYTTYGDIRYYEDIDEQVKNADRVYHLAALINVDKSIAHPQEAFDVNVEGTQNLLNACRRYHKPLVFASTSEIYGTQYGPIHECSETLAQSPYAIAKLAADKLCENYFTLYGTETYRIRCFNTYGPNQSEGQYGAVIPLFTRLILQGKNPQIFGDGEQMRDYIYIDDVVRAYEFLPTIKLLKGGCVNVGTGIPVMINKIADLIAIYTDKTIKLEHIASRSGEVRKLQADISKLKSFGFYPKVLFEEGLKKYIDFVMGNAIVKT
jgi:UDP-glucose 4-epimerase